MKNITRDFRWSFLFFISCLQVVTGQESVYGPDYQTTLISNPALTGSEGDGTIHLLYKNLYPGNGFDLHSVSLSYDGYFPSLHGGAGFYISDNYLGGIVNDLKGGFSYAYFFRAARDLYFSAGLAASFFNRGLRTGGAILPDQIDPLRGVVLPSQETLISGGKTIFDLGTGFLFISGRFFGGISVSHLTNPDLSRDDMTESRLNRILLIHFSGDFDISSEKNLKIRPTGMLKVHKGYTSFGAGAVFESNYLSVNSLIFTDNGKNIDIQTGFSLSAESIVIFYNYRFNIMSGKEMLPISLMHQTGVAFSLNNVEKRKTIKTINFPKL